jgi:hypothetical protein
MFWIALRLAAAAAGVSLVLYGAYIDGQRQKAKRQKMLHR